ncbi:tRNA-uridine aminocarboxypropyltransferase [Alteromonas facilis]|uniref:tRNA-uridine aminocarboxypropyltransferase n=1 Tax=Alteromonas facilis TaxID=2048004 RepID=UPI001F0BA1E9|nr:tRNA-uridine aminocarboxypropyltransferase [Alteromonas facilis]
MTNSVMALRKHEMLTAQRPFLARGAKIKRCEDCILPKRACICDVKPKPVARSAFVFLMYHGEYYKPSNTGRLIADVARENFAFVWNRTQPNDALLALLRDPRYMPVVIFPHQYASAERCISEVPNQDGRIPLFVMLDGTWREAQKMFTKSPYLNDFPVLGINPEKSSAYVLRESAHKHQLCTAEVGVAVLRLAGDTHAAESLEHYFNYFRTRYLQGKMHQL